MEGEWRRRHTPCPDVGEDAEYQDWDRENETEEEREEVRRYPFHVVVGKLVVGEHFQGGDIFCTA